MVDYDDMVPFQNRPVHNRPLTTDHSKQTCVLLFPNLAPVLMKALTSGCKPFLSIVSSSLL